MKRNSTLLLAKQLELLSKQIKAPRFGGKHFPIPPAPQQLPPSDEHRWSKTILKASKAVVSLRLCNVRSFDSVFSSSGFATGFVVDSELGLILTNRHVVLVGPLTSEAIFENHEGVVCQPIYRDPIHDFGFCKL
jgi:S1-C subfamily serine protease